MAYALGYITADGNVLHDELARAYYLKITSTDLERLEYFKTLLGSAHPIRELPKSSKSAKRIYALRIGDKKLFDALVRLGMDEKKSLTMELPSIPKKYVSHYLRGYFDGDGCVFVEQSTGVRGQKIDKALRIIFTSGSKKFLEQLNDIIYKVLKIHKRILPMRRAFQIRYSTSDSIRLFTFMYATTAPGAMMQRKYESFKTYFDRRKDKVSKEVENVLEYLNGHVAK